MDRRLSILESLLGAFTPGDDRERDHLARMHSLLASTAAPCSREQYEPGHFTASAFVFSPSTRSALLIAHPTLGLWLQPGGHIEASDASPLEAARREILEETGLRVRLENSLFDIDIHQIPARGGAPAHLHFDLRFLAGSDGEPVPASPEGVAARWVTLERLPDLVTDTSVRRMAKKASA